MTWYTNLVEQRMELADDGGDLLCKIACIHYVVFFGCSSHTRGFDRQWIMRRRLLVAGEKMQ